MNESLSPKWYNRTWLMITLGVIFFPFGLYGLWKNQRLKRIGKIGISVVSPFTTFLFLSLMYGLAMILFFEDQIQFDAATIKYEHNDYTGAIADYNSAIRINPAYAKAYMMRGNAYDKLGDQHKAITDYTLAIQFDSSYADAYFNRGFTNAKLKKFKEALADFNAVIAHDSTYADAYVERGNVKTKLVYYTNREIMDDYDKAIKINPVHTIALFNRGLVKMNMWLNKEALTDFDQAIRLSYEPKGGFFYYRGLLKKRLLQYESACKDFDMGSKLGDSKALEELKSNCH